MEEQEMAKALWFCDKDVHYPSVTGTPVYLIWYGEREFVAETFSFEVAQMICGEHNARLCDWNEGQEAWAR